MTMESFHSRVLSIIHEMTASGEKEFLRELHGTKRISLKYGRIFFHELWWTLDSISLLETMTKSEKIGMYEVDDSISGVLQDELRRFNLSWLLSTSDTIQQSSISSIGNQQSIHEWIRSNSLIQDLTKSESWKSWKPTNQYEIAQSMRTIICSSMMRSLRCSLVSNSSLLHFYPRKSSEKMEKNSREYSLRSESTTTLSRSNERTKLSLRQWGNMDTSSSSHELSRESESRSLLLQRILSFLSSRDKKSLSTWIIFQPSGSWQQLICHEKWWQNSRNQSISVKFSHGWMMPTDTIRTLSRRILKRTK